MKVKKILPVLCMALGLAMAVPMAAGATGSTSTETESTATNVQKGWNTLPDGRRFYILEDGTRAIGFKWISKDLVYFKPDGYQLQPSKAGRVVIDGKNYYNLGPNYNYTFQTSGWIEHNGNKTAFYALGPAENGELVTNNVMKIGSRYYGFNQYGQRWTVQGRRRLNGKVYYVSKSGYLIANKWQPIKIGGITLSYYFNTKGEMTGMAKRVINSKTYYYQVETTSGKYSIQKNGWHQDYLGRTFYVTSIGRRLATGFKVIDGKRYYFSPRNGMLYTDRWLIVNKKAYRADKNGVILIGWYTVGSKKYYGNSVGARVTGLQKIGGQSYYFNAAGVLQTGWKTSGGKRYYFDPTGSGDSLGMAKTGWFDMDGKTYYANSDGSLFIGKLVYNNNYYYLDPSNGGAAIKGRTVTIDGESCTFDSMGRLVQNLQPEIPGPDRPDRPA